MNKSREGKTIRFFHAAIFKKTQSVGTQKGLPRKTKIRKKTKIVTDYIIFNRK